MEHTLGFCNEVDAGMINTVFLNTFRVLAETSSFVDTAKKLRMTQPGVSQHLKNLEDYFGCTLVVRKGRLFQLTEEGMRVKAYSDDLFATHDTFKSTLTVDDPHVGACHIASPGSFGLKLYTHLLELGAQHANLSIHMTVAPSLSVIRGILEGTYQLGFVNETPEDPMLIAKKVSEEQLLLVTPQSAKASTYADLVALGFTSHPDGFAYANRLLALNFPKEFRSISEFKHRGHINQINRILDPIAHGLGFTVIPEFAFKAYPNPKKLNVMPLKKQLFDPVYAVHKKFVTLPARYEFVLKSLRKDLGPPL